MRLLTISNTPFLPATAGNRRRIDAMLAFFLDRGIEVGMVMLPADDIDTWDVEGMRARLPLFEIAAPPPLRPADALQAAWSQAGAGLGQALRRLRHASAPSRSSSGRLDAWCPRWFRTRTAALIEQWDPDVVLVEYVFLSACLIRIPPHGVRPRRRVIDAHDVMHRRLDVYATAGLRPTWFHTTAAEEGRGLARADLVLAIHEADAEILRPLVPGRTVLVVPHGQTVRSLAAEDAAPERLLYVASYNDLNVHALGWFLREVWPRVRVARPAAALGVCGNIAEKLGSLPGGVTVRGPLPSVRDEYARARLVIDPAQAATGLQIKLVEALCHGRPVVATPAGAAGIDSGPDNGVMVAATAAAFAEAIVRLLADDTHWRRLVAGATAQALRRFSPEAAFGPLLQHLAEKPPGASPEVRVPTA
jgi:glycosyltransferase involved in cell wall biosynthesis